MSSHSKFVPLIVASPLFLQNVDTTAMVLALPSIAGALGVPILQLNLIITTYALSLAVFLPVSAWRADRLGARRVFCWAIVVFALGSGLCALAGSLTQLVLCRVLQGLGGAMMLPVGRLILLRAVAPSELVGAMVWYTVPPLVGRLSGPLIGGAIVGMGSWQWIFLVNIPLGLAALLLALWQIDEDGPAGAPQPFDLSGFLLMALGLALLLGALRAAGNALVPGWLGIPAAALGAGCLYLYVRTSGAKRDPLIDLSILRYQTLRTNVLGAAPLRLGLAAVPFLLPLLMQVGFGLLPMQAGAIVAAAACGALCTRTVTRRAIGRFGFRSLLLAATGITAAVWSSLALLSPATPYAMMFALIFCSGFISSLCMVLLNTLGFAEVPQQRASHASALTTMAQQLLAAGGVMFASMLLALFSWHGGASLALRDFAAAFVTVGLLPLASLLAFRRLRPDEGAHLR